MLTSASDAGKTLQLVLVVTRDEFLCVRGLRSDQHMLCLNKVSDILYLLVCFRLINLLVPELFF